MLQPLLDLWPIILGIIGMTASILTYLWRIKVEQIEGHACTKKVEAKVDAVNEKLGALTVRVDAHLQKADSSYEKLVRVETRLNDHLEQGEA